MTTDEDPGSTVERLQLAPGRISNWVDVPIVVRYSGTGNELCRITVGRRWIS